MRASLKLVPLALLLLLPLRLSGCTGVDRKLPWEKEPDRSWSQKNLPSFPSQSTKPRRVEYWEVATTSPTLAITFDDGPHKENTPRLLDLLRERHIRGTFYLVGQNVKYYPALTKRIAQEGHEIANHTWSHPTLSRMPDHAVRRELQLCRDVIFEAAGVEPRHMRPPGGALTKAQRQWIYHEFGYPVIFWTVDPLDWKRPGVSVVVQRLVTGAKNGAILLTHDIHAPTIEAIPQVLDQLSAKGFRFVTVSELLAMEPPQAELMIMPAELKELTKERAPSGSDQ